ncbi:MAG: hypothetical protein M3N95_18060 [Actinomycetota bacterium]|nr:hypothetical protein [Actinomycetota bacterium]
MGSSDEIPTSHPEGHEHGGWAEPAPDAGRESSHKSFDASNASEPGPEPVESKEEREGVPPDDMSARSALGVGESTSRRGEDVRTKGSGGSDRSTDEDTSDGATPASARDSIGS